MKADVHQSWSRTAETPCWMWRQSFSSGVRDSTEHVGFFQIKTLLHRMLQYCTSL